MKTSYITESTILAYLEKNNSLSIGEAMLNFQLSGGHLTKLISNLRKSGHNIKTTRKPNPVTGRKYADYSLIKS